MKRRLLAIELCLVAALGATAAAGFHRVFTGGAFLAPLTLAAIGATAVSVACRWRRKTWSGSVFLSFCAYLVVTTVTVLGDTTPNIVPTIATFRGLSAGLVDGWAELLTATLPASAEGSAMVAALAMVWVATMVSAEFVLRSRHVLAPVLPLIGAYSATLALAAAQPHSPLALPVVFAALTLVLLLVHVNRWSAIEPGGLRLRHADPSAPEAFTEESTGRSIAMGVPVALAAVGIAALVGLVLPNEVLHKPLSARDARAERVVSSAVASPLASLKDQLKLEPEAPLFSVSLNEPDGAAAARSTFGSKLRLMTLDAYDGANWSSTARYRKVGQILPKAEAQSAGYGRHELRQTVTIDGLKGPWLPAADRPDRVEQSSATKTAIQFDLDGGSLLTSTTDRPGLTYQVTSLVVDTKNLPAGTSSEPLGKGFNITRFVPAQIPPELGELARRMAGDSAEPMDQLRSLEAALRGTYGYSEQVDGGHSIGRIRRFLLEDDSGYAEQFASAYAIMARLLGYPSRLAVGYLLQEPGSNDILGTDPMVVTSRATHVWPEIYLGGSGWVGFDPTPARTAVPPIEDVAARKERVEALLRETQGTPSGVFIDQSNDPARGGLSTAWSIMLGLLLAAVTGVFCLPLAKVLRRRLRRGRARTPADRVIGAWAEVTDRLLEVGVPLKRSMTTRQVIELSAAQLGSSAGEQLDVIAPAVTEALFAPEQPEDSVADQVAEQADAFRRSVSAGQPWHRRVVAWFNPRPLLQG